MSYSEHQKKAAEERAELLIKTENARQALESSIDHLTDLRRRISSAEFDARSRRETFEVAKAELDKHYATYLKAADDLGVKRLPPGVPV